MHQIGALEQSTSRVDGWGMIILKIRCQLVGNRPPPARDGEGPAGRFCSPVGSARRAAFTLVELLVSMAVLVLMTVGLASLVNGVSRTTTLDRRHMEADNEARRIFDRMDSDFARMLKRPDADSIFASIIDTPPQGPNDKMFFYSEAPAFFDNAPPGASQGTVALIGYRVPNANTVADPTHRWQLERLGKGLTWDRPSAAATPGAVVFLTYPVAPPPPAPQPTPFPASTLADASNWGGTIGTAPNYEGTSVDPDFHVLSSHVFRLEYCFVMKTAAASGSPFSVTHAQGRGFRDVSAIVVAIALLDPQGRSQVPGTAPGSLPNLKTLASALPDPDFASAPNKLMAEIWSGKLKDGSFAAAAGVPPVVANQVRVYQRCFYLNTLP